MSQPSMSRRCFLKRVGVAAGTAGLTLSGIGLVSVNNPELEFPEPTFGEEKMSKRILVAYASRAGSTAGVAEAIGKILADRGAQVDVRNVNAVTDLSPYQAVVVGSAVRGGKWLPEAVQFLQTHRTELSQKPFAAFMVCITLAMSGAAKYRDGVADWMRPVRNLVRPISEGLFAGALDCGKLSLLDGLQMRAAIAAGIFPEGDHRDWNSIRAWAEGLDALFQV